MYCVDCFVRFVFFSYHNFRVSLKQDSEFYLSEEPGPDELTNEEWAAQFWQRLEGCQTMSLRLERARKSQKAKDFFARPPDKRQGYDQMWVAAIDNAMFKCLSGNLQNYGIQFADNFGDWDDLTAEDSLNYSIEDLASMKARKTFEMTGLPCIASRNSFQVEPVAPPPSSTSSTSSPQQQASAPQINNPRILSGYKINDIGNHVDYLSEALGPVSEPDRVTRFESCLCYYDGEMEIFEHGVCDVDLVFCNSMRTYIPINQAINNMIQTLILSLDLEYQKWLRQKVEDVAQSYGKASLQLRDRVLKDAQVLPNDIIDVSKFMDSLIDVNLMDDCAKELVSGTDHHIVWYYFLMERLHSPLLFLLVFIVHILHLVCSLYGFEANQNINCGDYWFGNCFTHGQISASPRCLCSKGTQCRHGGHIPSQFFKQDGR